jgi:hypothetical protein
MKNKIILLSFLLLGFVSFGCEDSKEAAIDYNNAIVDVDFAVLQHFDFFVHFVDEGDDSLKTMEAFQEALDTARVGLAKVQAMPEFKGNTTLRDAAKALLQYYVKALDVEYRAILPVLMDTSSTLEDFDRVGAMLEKSKREEDSLYILLEAQQKAFAEKYKFELLKE